MRKIRNQFRSSIRVLLVLFAVPSIALGLFVREYEHKVWMRNQQDVNATIGEFVTAVDKYATTRRTVNRLRDLLL